MKKPFKVYFTITPAMLMAGKVSIQILDGTAIADSAEYILREWERTSPTEGSIKHLPSWTDPRAYKGKVLRIECSYIDSQTGNKVVIDTDPTELDLRSKGRRLISFLSLIWFFATQIFRGPRAKRVLGWAGNHWKTLAVTALVLATFAVCWYTGLISPGMFGRATAFLTESPSGTNTTNAAAPQVPAVTNKPFARPVTPPTPTPPPIIATTNSVAPDVKTQNNTAELEALRQELRKMSERLLQAENRPPQQTVVVTTNHVPVEVVRYVTNDPSATVVTSNALPVLSVPTVSTNDVPTTTVNVAGIPPAATTNTIPIGSDRRIVVSGELGGVQVGDNNRQTVIFKSQRDNGPYENFEGTYVLESGQELVRDLPKGKVFWNKDNSVLVWFRVDGGLLHGTWKTPAEVAQLKKLGTTELAFDQIRFHNRGDETAVVELTVLKGVAK